MARTDDVTTEDLATARDRTAPPDSANGDAAGARNEAAPDDTDVERAESASSGSVKDSGPEPLLPNEETASLHQRWEEIQAGFVDEPRSSVEEADKLVAQLMKRLAESFATERAKLEGQWDRGDDVNTDDLRVALQRYRSFFQRLLAI
jgi:hypothetical protein